MIYVTVCGNDTPFFIKNCKFGNGIGAFLPKKYALDATDSPIINTIFGLFDAAFDA